MGYHRDPRSNGTLHHTKLDSCRSKCSQWKKSQKVARRSLSSELSSSEDASRELTGISSLSEAVDANPDGEVTEVLESLDANCQSKKLLAALIKNNIDKFSHVSEENARFDGFISHKVCLPFLCLVFGILSVIVFSSGLKRSRGVILPT